MVEDNDGLRRLAKRLLEQAGYKVHCASSGNDALRVLATLKAPVDLLLTDLVMPGMSGRHLAEAATASYPGMRVLYMSGYTSDGVIRRGVIAAESAFLDKPFTAAALLAKVREVLGPVRA